MPSCVRLFIQLLVVEYKHAVIGEGTKFFKWKKNVMTNGAARERRPVFYSSALLHHSVVHGHILLLYSNDIYTL